MQRWGGAAETEEYEGRGREVQQCGLFVEMLKPEERWGCGGGFNHSAPLCNCSPQ